MNSGEILDGKRIDVTHLICVGLVVAFGIVLLRTAWLSDDAYITFRIVDNFTGGHGLRWNVAERVQASTHPLWLLVLCGLSLLTREVYFTSLVLSILLSLATVYLVTFRSSSVAHLGMVGITILVCSRAFVEYSTSGLENALTHLLLAVFALLLVASKCGGGDGTGGGPLRVTKESPDPRCTAVVAEFPGFFDFVRGIEGRVIVPEFTGQIDSFDVDFAIPEAAAGVPPFSIPADSDGDGSSETFLLML